MTEERFVELMNRIPIMEEKLERLLLAFDKIVESGNLLGIKRNEEFPHFEYDEGKAEDDKMLLKLSGEKLAAAEELQKEANEIRNKLGF